MSLFLRLLSADWKQNGVRRNVRTIPTAYPIHKKMQCSLRILKLKQIRMIPISSYNQIKAKNFRHCARNFTRYNTIKLNGESSVIIHFPSYAK